MTQILSTQDGLANAATSVGWFDQADSSYLLSKFDRRYTYEDCAEWCSRVWGDEVRIVFANDKFAIIEKQHFTLLQFQPRSA